jgi:fatty-acyl-CoA synthase
LYTHPSVQDVQVVGIPDAHFGEEVCACIVLRKDHTATVDEVS